MRIVLNAYAKINLSIDVTGRLENGYHEIDTVMQSISLCDTLTVQTDDANTDVRLKIKGQDLKLDDNNTVLLAVKYFFEAYGKTRDCGLDITLEKRIPSAAGLGGGSADGAAMLEALNIITGNPFSREELTGISLKIGADVPFCLLGGTVRVQGIGDVLMPIKDLKNCSFVLFKNAIKASTGEMYRKIDSIEAQSDIDVDAVQSAIEQGDILTMSQNCKNIFLSVWEDTNIKSFISRLAENGALTASLSGSGPTLYGIFTDEKSARRAFDDLAKEYDEVFLANPVSCGVEVVNQN